ncbi:MAG: HepT-like ribonuclease domain-containing protein [Pseudomonadota bacterium]
MALLPEDRARLIKYADFLETELSDFPRFSRIGWKKYNEDRDARRNIERWVENIVSCSIDMAKVLLVAEGRDIPPTYKEVVRAIGALPHFDEKLGDELSRWVALRNVIAHEYLDLSWARIEKFLKSAEPSYCSLVTAVKAIL